jgi:hypothetical protein
MNGTLGETDIFKIESRIHEMLKKCMYSLFTNNGKDKGGLKLISLLLEHKEEILHYKVDPKYRNIECEQICEFLKNNPDISYIDLNNESNKISIHFLFYIWIHNWSFLSKINYEAVSKSKEDPDGAYLIYILFNAFTEFKNKVDGRSIEHIENATKTKGGSSGIRLTMRLVLLLITFCSISAPGDSNVVDNANYPELYKQIASVTKRGTEIGNDVNDQFVTFLNFAKEIPYAVREMTVYSVEFYHHTGLNSFLESSTGISLMTLLDYGLSTEHYLTKAKTQIGKSSMNSQNEFGKKIAKFLNINENFAQKTVHKTVDVGTKIIRAGIIHKATQIGEKMFKNKLKGSAIGVIAGTMIANIDSIIDLLKENRSSMYTGSCILHLLGGFKNLKNKSLNFIHDKFSANKLVTHQFDLNQEYDEIAIFMENDEESTMNIFKELLKDDILLGGRKIYTKKRCKNRKRRSRKQS